MDMQKFYDMAIIYTVKYGLQAIMAAVILFIGWKLANWAARLTGEALQKKHLDVTLSHFIAGIVKAVVMAFAILMALDKLGITINPLIATISAAVFGASFAIQAPLSNYAAGLSIILTRPFVVGDTISIKGYSGVVQEVKLPSTVLMNGDGERITIPNKDIVGEVITNSHHNSAADIVVGISYSDDPEKAIAVIRATLKKFPDILQDQGPFVGIQSFGDSSININVRYWAPTSDARATLHAANLAVYKALLAAQITIPFPRRDVHVFPGEKAALLAGK